nr:hypothetical protein [uncultured Flavobacterium sp.]
MNIGIITYKNDEKQLLLNWNFHLLELLSIMLNDKDFVRFQIVDRNNNLLLSTHYPDIEQNVIYIKVVKIEKDKEITRITYDAFRTPSTFRRIKVRWNVNGVKFRVKKRALDYVYWQNRKASMKIESFVDRR